MSQKVKRVLLIFHLLVLATALLPETWLPWVGKAFASSSRISTVAGTGEAGFSGDGGAATSAKLNSPYGVAVDSSGNLYISDNINNRIRKITPDGIISTLAGTGEEGYSGDGGPAILAQLKSPRGIAVDSSGNVYFADTGNHRIRKISANGTISTVAGTGQSGYYGNGVPAVEARLSFPYGVAVDNSGNVYIVDSYNSRIRKITSDGMITTVAGTFEQGYSGDGGPATEAELSVPFGMAIDNNGNIYIADTHNKRIRKITTDGIINTIAGTGVEGFTGDGGAAVRATMTLPRGIAVDSNGNVFFADHDNSRIRKISNNGIISTVAGSGWYGESGDGIDPTLARILQPQDVAVDSNGFLYISDSSSSRIRKVVFTKMVIFESNGGTAVNSQSIIPGDKAIEPVNPTRAGHTFAGWYADSDLKTPFDFNAPITKDTIVYAKWQVNTYTLTYTAGANGLISGNTSQTVNHGANGTAVTAVPNEGYHFVKWSDGNTNATRTDVNVTANVNVIAEFAINKYTLSYNAGRNGTIRGDASQTVNHGDDGTAVTAVPNEGYHFVKWSDGNTEATRTDTNVTANVNVTAEFAINTYTLTYTAGANGTISGDATQTVDHGSSGTAVTAVADEGYHFVKWSDGNTNATRTDTNVTANVNVTAEFEINGYAVSFESNGGSEVDSQTVNYGGKVSEPPAPTRTGYTFVGWFVDIDLMTPFDFMTPVTKDVTLYAKWTINSYTVIFEENGGTAVDSQTVNHGDTATEPIEPTRPGYVFDGWHMDMDLTVPFDFSTPIIGDLTLYAKWRLPDQVAKPKATPSGGAVLSGTPVVLSTTTVSAAVYYTTDGTEPSVYSIKYAGPIEVTRDMTIKAIAVKEGMLDSDVLTEHYTIATLPAPVSLTATPSDRSVILNWHAAAKERSVTDAVYQKESSVTYAVYQVEGVSAPVDPANWELVQAHITANTFTVTGLTNGKSYAFAVKAMYAEGESDFSNVATAMPKARDDGGGSGDDGGSGGSPGGGGHGGSGGGSVNDSGMILSTTGVITIPVGRSGEVHLDDEIIIKVSSGAAEQELRITIEKLLDTSSLLTDQEMLVSPVFEVLKNVSSNFKKPVTLSIKFDPAKVGKNQKVAIFYYDEDRKTWVEVDGTVVGEWITAEVDHFTKFAILAVEVKKEVDVNKESDGETPKQLDPTFTDISGHWGESSIILAASQKLVSGYPDGTFKPNNPVTRTEFTVMLVGALQLNGTGAALHFKDQDKIGAWAKRAVALAVQAGIVSGYEDGSFRPDAQITRAEMASMIAKALKMSLDANVTTSFVDDEDIPKWAKGAVETIRKLGIVSGRGGNKFVPNDTATRAEGVVMLLRMLEQRN